MSVLYLSFWSKVRTCGCVFMGSAVVFILIALIVCRVWSEQSAHCFV